MTKVIMTNYKLRSLANIQVPLTKVAPEMLPSHSETFHFLPQIWHFSNI